MNISDNGDRQVIICDEVDVLGEVNLLPIENIQIPYFNMFHLSSIDQIQIHIINEQLYLNTYNVFYPQYSPHHVLEQGIRNVEKEILFAMACR